ncbi:MAG: flagellar protein FlbB [Pseudolabrys sp.]|nr:flagellar protein FlbB [Pseudolabrys sp.]
MRLLRDVRLIPLVIVATVSLFALKVSGLFFDGGYTLGDKLASRGQPSLTITSRDDIPEVTPIIIANQQAGSSANGGVPGGPWAKEMFNFGRSAASAPQATATATGNLDITGSVSAKPAEAPPPKPAKPGANAADPPKDPGGKVVMPEERTPPGERAILERLSERRGELDARGRDLEMRENLLKAAEKRMEARLEELKAVESRINSALGTRDKEEAQRFKNIVTMYETMKPKEAARIFDRLEIKILVEVTSQMKPATMSAILAQMSPEAAEKLTIELASRAANEKAKGGKDALPKIEGQPNG